MQCERKVVRASFGARTRFRYVLRWRTVAGMERRTMASLGKEMARRKDGERPCASLTARRSSGFDCNVPFSRRRLPTGMNSLSVQVRPRKTVMYRSLLSLPSTHSHRWSLSILPPPPLSPRPTHTPQSPPPTLAQRAAQPSMSQRLHFARPPLTACFRAALIPDMVSPLRARPRKFSTPIFWSYIILTSLHRAFTAVSAVSRRSRPRR